MESDPSYLSLYNPDLPQTIHVVGGGAIEPVREHLALSARAYGNAARYITQLANEYWADEHMETALHLTRMADPNSTIETTGDLRNLAHKIIRDEQSKVVFWSPAVPDFKGTIPGASSGLHAERLDSQKVYDMHLTPNRKILPMFRHDIVEHLPPRKDLFVVGFKTTTGAEPEEQYSKGLRLLKKSSANLVLANDTVTRNNMVITPEEAPYHETTDREIALNGLVEMAHLRSRMHYVRTNVERGENVSWDDDRIPSSLRRVVQHCIDRGAYKVFNGVTTGHFSAKLGPNHILSSRRKTNFNNIASPDVGMVETTYDDNGVITAYGSKPSAGARAQIEVYNQFPQFDSIVHVHCPMKEGSEVATVEQRPYECGSFECGDNTAKGLHLYEDDEIGCVMLDHHGPNVVFSSNTNPQKVIDFIERNFDLTAKTGGYIPKS